MADYRNVIPFILQKEGGLSRNPKDTASSHPSPYTIRARDFSKAGAPYVTANDWHTNKGVTYQTFSSLASKLGYKVNQQNFELMPQEIWGKIFKAYYWDRVKGDNLASQKVANLLADWYWGSGNWAVKNLQEVLNRNFDYTLAVNGTMNEQTLKAANKVNADKLFELLHKEKLNYYQQIVKNNPSQSTFIKGWIKRANDLYDANKGVIAAGGGIVVAIALVIGGYLLYKTYGA